MLGRLTTAATAATLVATLAGAVKAEPTVEVLHWWTSGGEARAVGELKEAFEAAGGEWIDSPIAGGGGDAAMTALRARVMSGNPPTAVQLKGPSIQEWAREGVLADLDPVAREENWTEKLPPLIVDTMQYDGSYVAAPVNVHRVDWIWANPEVLAEVGAAMPTSLDEFNATAGKLQEAGITSLAHGGQPWQDATIFEVVVLELGGAEFFERALVDLEDAALRSDTMVAVFDQLRTIRGFVDDNFSGRDWNLATAMVINGEAAFQIMGDWAKGEFLAADLVPGEDFLCAAAPGEGFLLNTDSFVMFDVGGGDREAGQKLLARLIMGEDFQRNFNLAKGSIPARTDVELDGFDACAKRSKADLAAAREAGTLLPSMAHEMAVPRSQRGVFLDLVTEHFNSDMGSQEAATRLADAVARSQ